MFLIHLLAGGVDPREHAPRLTEIVGEQISVQLLAGIAVIGKIAVIVTGLADPGRVIQRETLAGRPAAIQPQLPIAFFHFSSPLIN